MGIEDEIVSLTKEINAFALSRNWLPLNESEETWHAWKRLRKPSSTNTNTNTTTAIATPAPAPAPAPAINTSTHNTVSTREAHLLPIWEQCSTILNGILQNRNAYIFAKPVDPIRDGVPNYFEVIKKPMDLGTVKQRLALQLRRRNESIQSSMYRCPLEMKSDVDQVWENCFLYHLPEYEVRKLGEALKREFDYRWKAMKIEESVHRINNQYPLSTVAESVTNRDHPKEEEDEFPSVTQSKKLLKKRKPGSVDREKKNYQTQMVTSSKELDVKHKSRKGEEDTIHHNEPLVIDRRGRDGTNRNMKLSSSNTATSNMTHTNTNTTVNTSMTTTMTNSTSHMSKKKVVRTGSKSERVNGVGNKQKEQNHSQVHNRKDNEKKGTQLKSHSKTVEEKQMMKLFQSCRPVKKSAPQNEVQISQREWLPPIERGGGASVSKPKSQVPKQAVPALPVSKDKDGEKESVLKETLSLNEELRKSLEGLENKSESEMTDFEVRRRLSMLLETVTPNMLNILIAKVLSKDRSFTAGESNLDQLEIKYVRSAVRSLLGAKAQGVESKGPSAAQTKQISPVKEESNLVDLQSIKKRKKSEDEGTPLATKTPRVSPPSPPWDRGLIHNRAVWENAVGNCGITPRLNGQGLGLTPRQESNGSIWEEAIPDEVEEGEIRN